MTDFRIESSVSSGSSIGSAITGGTPGSTLFVGGTIASPTMAEDNQGYFFDDTENRLSVFTTLSSEELSNPDFTGSASSWTVPSGMAYSSNTVVKSSNGTGALTQSISAKVLREYNIQLVFTSFTAGSVTVTFGGFTHPTSISTAGTFNLRFVVATSTGIAINPTNTARFTIDSVSAKPFIGTNTKANINTGGLSVEGEWSNGTPNTTRAMTINNDGSYSWTDYRFSGVLRGALGYSSSGGLDIYQSGGNGVAFYSSNSGLTSNSLYQYSTSTALVHYGYGEFLSGFVTGSVQQPTSKLQVVGGSSFKVKKATTSQSLDNTATYWIGDASTPVCTGTPSATCASWGNQTDCEKWDAHGGCTWFAGNPCSAFDNESGMTTCSGTSGCTVVTASCVGPTDESTCVAQDDSYGGSCSWSATGDCSPFDESTCGSTSGCTQNFIDCSIYFDDFSTCTGTTGCSWSAGAYDCSADDGTDQATCEANSGCVWNGGSNTCEGSCSGTGPFTSCSGSYYACSGNYNTGSCTGTYGAACSGTPTCSGIDDSTNCGNETGCSWVTALNFTLPDGETCDSRVYGIKNGSSTSANVNVLPYSGQTVEMLSAGIVLSNYQDAVFLAYYKDTTDCSVYSQGDCTTYSSAGCTVNMSNCTWDSGGSTCSGNAVCVGIGDQTTCEATTYFNSCSGTRTISKNWYIF